MQLETQQVIISLETKASDSARTEDSTEVNGHNFLKLQLQISNTYLYSDYLNSRLSFSD